MNACQQWLRQSFKIDCYLHIMKSHRWIRLTLARAEVCPLLQAKSGPHFPSFLLFPTLWQWSQTPGSCPGDDRHVRFTYLVKDRSRHWFQHVFFILPHSFPQNKITACINKKSLSPWDGDLIVRKKQFALENNLDPKWVSFSANQKSQCFSDAPVAVIHSRMLDKTLVLFFMDENNNLLIVFSQ